MDEIPERLRVDVGIGRPGRPDTYELHLLVRRQRAMAIGDAAARLGGAVLRLLAALTAGAGPALRQVLPLWRAVP